VSRAIRSVVFAVIYSIYLVAVMLPAQELILRPLCALNPKRRPDILRTWFRWQANWVLGMCRHLGGLELDIQGALPAEPLIVVMNHQSLLDIPAAVSLLRGPYPVIPTRDRYTRWIPGISGLARLAGFPALRQSGRASRAEHAAMVGAAEAVAKGERTLIIYPEGHRSKNGEVQPWMAQGLKLVFRHVSNRPVYVLVIDGAWRLRSFADIAFRLSGQVARVRVSGPFAVPPDKRDHDAFIESLREHMVDTLAHLRGSDPAGSPGSASAPLAHPVG
jgi:1-acyl-sn-glycerol-3-phosphate acyltransferase